MQMGTVVTELLSELQVIVPIAIQQLLHEVQPLHIGICTHASRNKIHTVSDLQALPASSCLRLAWLTSQPLHGLSEVGVE